MIGAGVIVAFADLDDTLFQTRRKLPGHDPRTLSAATLDTHGMAHSYSTPAQLRLLELLETGGVTLIPVTGRTPLAMSRVLLPFTSFRVLDHGLTILTPDGEPEAVWAERVCAELEPLQTSLADLSAQVEGEVARLGGRLTRHRAHGLDFMSVIKHPQADPAALSELAGLWRGALTGGDEQASPWQVIANANNVSLLPRALGKLEAVRYLRGQHFQHATLTLGLGDSVSDLPFLAACDFALTPGAGQLMGAALGANLIQE